LPIDTGIRNYFDKFRLPGEAQKVDRIMDAFSKAYCQANP